MRWSLRARGRISEAARGNASTNELQGYVVDQVTALKHTLRKMSGVDTRQTGKEAKGSVAASAYQLSARWTGFPAVTSPRAMRYRFTLLARARS